MSFCLGSTNVNAGYYYYQMPSIPDYEPVICDHSHYHHYPRSSSKHFKSHRASVSHAKHSHYSISTYYVYSTPAGDMLWVPAPCECQGRWVPARAMNSYHQFNEVSYAPDHSYKSTYYSGYDDMGYNMDMRTGDDVRD